MYSFLLICKRNIVERIQYKFDAVHPGILSPEIKSNCFNYFCKKLFVMVSNYTEPNYMKYDSDYTKYGSLEDSVSITLSRVITMFLC